MSKIALLELAKSFGRFLWFGILALIGTFITSLLTSGAITDVVLEIAGQQIDATFIVLGALGLIVKAIDRYRHVSENTNSNGIAPQFLQN